MNLISMDIFRAKKNKSTWVFIFLVTIMNVINVCDKSDGGSITEKIMICFQNGNMFLIGLIFVLHLSDKYVKFSYIKNITDFYSNRCLIPITHTVTTVAFNLLCLIFSYIFSFVFAKIQNVELGQENNYCDILLQFCLLVLFECMIACMYCIFSKILFCGIIGLIWFNYLFDFLGYNNNLSANYMINNYSVLVLAIAIGLMILRVKRRN